MDETWNFLINDYEIIQKLGEGSYGEVFQAKNRQTGKICAIKLIKDVFYSVYEAKKVLREIHILREISSQSNNIFVTKLLDVIVPPVNKRQKIGESNPNQLFNDIFLVQECFGQDANKYLKDESKYNLNEQHILIIIYNILCAINFFHSAHVVHRDIKPANILVDKYCNVRICDLGLARPLEEKPKKSMIKEAEF